MNTTLISSRNVDRSRLQSHSSAFACAHHGESVHFGASVHVGSPVCASRVTATTPVNTMNLWLGDAQSTGFGSKYATKRITPGRLEGMT